MLALVEMKGTGCSRKVFGKKFKMCLAGCEKDAERGF